MKELTVEAVFGVDAGIVWEALNKNGPSIIGDIVKATGFRRELVYGALGWLGRENKEVLSRVFYRRDFIINTLELIILPFYPNFLSRTHSSRSLKYCHLYIFILSHNLIMHEIEIHSIFFKLSLSISTFPW